jgi:hypothetical protein
MREVLCASRSTPQLQIAGCGHFTGDSRTTAPASAIGWSIADAQACFGPPDSSLAGVLQHHIKEDFDIFYHLRCDADYLQLSQIIDDLQEYFTSAEFMVKGYLTNSCIG